MGVYCLLCTLLVCTVRCAICRCVLLTGYFVGVYCLLGTLWVFTVCSAHCGLGLGLGLLWVCTLYHVDVHFVLYGCVPCAL